MDKNEQFVRGEEDGKAPKQSPRSSHTWPMDKIQQSRFQQKMASLLSPVTPKRNYSVRHAKSLLLQCLRDSKSDSVIRRRFPASYSDDGILMDGVLVTSATGKKVPDSPSSSLGRSARSSIIRSQHKNTEFCSPRSQSGRKQETTQSQHSSAGKVLENSPSTKAANPSKLQATAEPFIITPRSAQRLASPVPRQQLPFDYDLDLQWGNPTPHQELPSSYGHQYSSPCYAYPRPRPLYLHLPASPHQPDLYHTYLSRSPRPAGHEMLYDFNESPTITSLPKIPSSSSQPDTNTSDPPVHTPISANPTANFSTSTTIHGSRLDFPPSVDGLDTVTPKPDLSSPSDGLEKRELRLYLPPSDELETMTKELDFSSLSDELEIVTQRPDLSPYARLQTITTKKDWSPSDDGLETFAQAQTNIASPRGRILPDGVFKNYNYRNRLSVFRELCLDDNLHQPQSQ